MPYTPRNSIRFTPVKKKTWGADQGNYPFYNSQAWRKHRADYLKRNPLCRMCEAKGITTPAVMVDHIIPINQGGDMWDEVNQQPLCRSCHSVKSVNDRWNNEKQTNS